MGQPLDGVNALVASVERLPAVTLDCDGTRRSADIRVRGEVIASIDMGCGHVLIYSPPDTPPDLTWIFPSATATADRIAFDPGDCAGALAAIRRRVHMERLHWQFRVASP
jgi:hypothetical protein